MLSLVNYRKEVGRMEQAAKTTEIDDRFIGEWLDFGFREMGAYLDKHARFARFLDERDRRN